MNAQESCTPARTANPARPSILIVEDELIVAKDLQQTLVELGYDAFAIASSAEAAVTRAVERCPDLVMMDIRIKGPHDGIQTAAILKEQFSAGIIYLTAHADEAMVQRAKKTEPHGYLLKPVKAVELRTTVEIALYKQQLERARAKTAEVETQKQAALVDMGRAAHESNQHFRMMVEAVKDYAIFMLDVDGRIASWNVGAERLKGYSEQEIIGQHFAAFYTADDVADRKPGRNLETAARLGRTEDEGWRMRKDGTQFLANVVITAVHDSIGQLRGFAKVTRDVTARKQSEALLQQRIERFSVASSAAGFGFWDFDPVTHSLRWDDQMFQLFGRSRSEGKPPDVLMAESLHPDDSARSGRELTDTLSGIRPFDTEFRIVHPNGAVRYLKSAARITSGAHQGAPRMFGVSFDITERKLADEQFRMAIEAAPTGMLLMSRTGCIVLVNAEIENLFGYTRAELLGQRIEMLVPERFREGHPGFRQGFFSAPNARAMGKGRDLYGLRKDGSEMPVEIRLTPLQITAREFVLSSIIDLTQRREMDRMRSDFISTVSHELRTPLTSITGALGLVQSGAMGTLPDKAAAMVRIAYKNSGRLARIINDILDIGKLEAGQLSLQMVSVPLADLLQQSIEANLGYAEKCAVRFLLDDCPDNARVQADPDRLMQVVGNLLSNAAKFSPAGADVLIRVVTGMTHMRVEVEDSGPGIAEEFKRRIFEKFTQADSSATRGFEGTGLGLSIARGLVESMGGTIGFTSVVGQGSTFFLELRRGESLATEDRITPPSGIAARQVLLDTTGAADGSTTVIVPKGLHVEDDEDLINVIRANLDGRVAFVTAASLREAERLLGEERYDLIVLDPSSPDGNGLSLVDRIVGLVGHSMPIVILSGAEAPRDMRQKVAAVLVKSKASAGQIAATLLSNLGRTLPLR
jgi:PAS domain S-box-containing protein